ncbi:uncharacterized protein [Rutidosis leptorrhynchoides]|uniref:uncharacterized protein n=1 Tax=Rutidosis leptorrhynchoides TaxID=125765 RepID=UPI003A9A5C6D
MGDGTTSSVTLINKLDFGDPLYLHASDTATGTPFISIKLKGTENYNIWSRSMLLALGTKNKIGFIDGSVKKDETNEVLAKQWDRCNNVVLSWILGSMSEDLYSGQIFSTNAAVVWKELSETYDKVDASIVFNLHYKITTIKQNGQSIFDYYHTLNSLWKQYDALVKLPTCVCAAVTEFDEHNKMQKLMQFLMGLDDVYMTIRSNILSRDPVPDVKGAYAIISREESLRVRSGKESGKGSVSAFVAQTRKNNVNNNNSNNSRFNNFNNNNNNRFNNQGNRGPNPNLKCSKCNKLGHTIDRCFEIVGFPPGYRRPFNSGSSRNVSANNSVSDSVDAAPSSSVPVPFSLTNERMVKLMSLLSDNSSTS